MKKNLFYSMFIFIGVLLLISNLYSQDLFDTQYTNIDSLSYEWQVAGYDGGTGNIPEAQEIFNVTDYGALPDDGEDDSNDIQDAIDDAAATGVITQVYFPEGIYDIYNTLELESNVILQGNYQFKKDKSEYRSILKFDIGDNTENCIKVSGKTNAGIEDLWIKRIDIGSLPSGQQGHNILFENATNCWVIGVESYKPVKHHIDISESNNIEVRGCFFNDAQHHGDGGAGYGVCIEEDSHHCLVENNIFRKCRHAMLVQDHAHYNVFGYNYAREARQTSQTAVLRHEHTADLVCHGEPSLQSGGNYRGPYSNLFEGNICSWMWVDSWHLYNKKYNTFFRNKSSKYGLNIYGKLPILLQFLVDLFGYNEEYTFYDQPKQNIVNNYLKNSQYYWEPFLVLIPTLIPLPGATVAQKLSALMYAYIMYKIKNPRVLDGDTPFEKNSIVKRLNFWGQFYTRTYSDGKKRKCPEAWADSSYYHATRPVFMLTEEYFHWPFNPRYHNNIPSKMRWYEGNKKTISRHDDPIYWETTYWTIGGSPYIIEGEDFVVAKGACLKIEPGVKVKFGPERSLIIRGTLIAEGNEDEPIEFKNNTVYYWGNISFIGEGTEYSESSILKHCSIIGGFGRPVSNYIGNCGGGITAVNYDDIIIENCYFAHSFSNYGGAIFLLNSDIKIENSFFRYNKGCIQGAAISTHDSSPLIRNNMFLYNNTSSLDVGGVIYIAGYNSNSENVKIINNAIFSCDSYNDGCAIRANVNENDTLFFINNSFIGYSEDYGGVDIEWSNGIFINNIFWSYGGDSYQINITNGSGSFYNCIIQGGFSSINGEVIDTLNIINQDPNLSNYFYISNDSPCFNAGACDYDFFSIPYKSTLSYLPEKDYWGNPRIVPSDSIDIGACEAYEEGIYVEIRELPLGDITPGETQQDTIVVKNIGTNGLTLYPDSFIIPEGFEVLCESTVISHNDSTYIFVNFIPEQMFVDYSDTLVIYSSDFYFHKVPVFLNGRGMPTEHQQVFGEINNDETWEGYILLTGDVTITNGATLTISDNSEVYSVDGYKLSLESGSIIMNGAELYLRNGSEIDINGTITLSGGSLIEVASCSEFRLEPGSILYGTDHTIWEDTDTGKGYDTWVEMHEDVPNHNGNIVMIPGDRIVANSDGRFIACSGYGDDRITITSVGNDYYWDGIEINDGWSKSYLHKCDISKISYIKLNNSEFELVNSTFSNCNQIIASNESKIALWCNTFENNRACPIVLYESDGHIFDNNIINNEGNGISIYYLPLYGSVSVTRDTIQHNNGRGVDLYNVPVMFTNNEIRYNGNPDNPNSASSIGFFASGNSGGANMGGNTIENNYGIELLATRDAFPNLTFELNYHGPNIIYDEYDPDGYIYLDQFLLAYGGYDGNPIDVRGNDFPNMNDDDFEDRFLPFYDAYIFDGEKPPEKILYEEGIAEIADSLYESAKLKMKEIVDIYPETETAKNALQWLMYLEKFSGQDYVSLRAYIENIDEISYPHLEKTKYNTTTSTYMAEKDYEAVITRLESILANPPSVSDSIFAYIDEGYCYLKLDEQGSKSLPTECCFKPRCFEEFSYVSQNLLDKAIPTSKPPTTDPQTIEFALNQNFPNPAFQTTTFSFSLPANTKNAELKIYNIKGQLVKSFNLESSNKGVIENTTWDCKDDNGKTLCNGIYFYKLTADKKDTTKKMVIIR